MRIVLSALLFLSLLLVFAAALELLFMSSSWSLDYGSNGLLIAW